MANHLWERMLIERNPGLIGVHDLDGTIHYMNPAAAGALGYEPAELVGRNYAELVAPAVRPFFALAMERVRTHRSGEGLVLMRTKSGVQRRWWYRHVLLEDHGEPPLVLGDSADVTDIQLGDEALHESEQRFRYLAENIHQVFWVRDPRTGQILYLSPAFERVWGRPPAWILEQPFSFLETVHPDDRALVLSRFAESAGGQTTQMEYRIQRPDGSERWIASQSFPVRDAQGEVARIVAITEDVTARKQAEAALRVAKDAAEEAVRAKSQLLAHVSHEVRSPLQVIMGTTEILLDRRLPASQRADLERIDNAACTLLSLANDLLDFSKIEAHRLELRPVPFRVRDVLDAAMEPFRQQAAAKGVRLHAEVAATVPTEVVGDAERLRQIVGNLIGNATKFTEHGEVVVGVDRPLPSAAGEPVALRFEVRDTGPGIESADCARIFEPFSQAHTTTKRDYGGVGLGLAICRQLVELMGGRIELESAPGQGSMFSFTVRLAAAPAA